ncbi:hypothetical protein RRG08_001234 [Elysia crispata]|uniref:Uncharacterized protein n=1 Tax=Elysia crispata TaxID=231223 RepID=A0AAE1EB46_9GAST|nr:hypothetical protein RRG08_001234 [Elysia crispata]
MTTQGHEVKSGDRERTGARGKCLALLLAAIPRLRITSQRPLDEETVITACNSCGFESQTRHCPAGPRPEPRQEVDETICVAC